MTARSTAWRSGAALSAVAVVLAACGTSRPVTPRATFSIDGELSGYGPCTVPAPAAAAPERMVLPEEAVVTTSRTDGPLTEVHGFLPLTPIQVRRHYEERQDIGILSLEDEVLEAEVLLEVDGYRTFLRANVACDTGSRFIAVGGANTAPVPAPSGGATTP